MIDSFNGIFAQFGLFGIIVLAAVSSAILVRDNT